MEITIIPSREMFYSSETCFGIYGCNVHRDDINKVKLNKYGNISVKGNMPKLTTGTEYIASLEEYKDEKYGDGYLLLNIRQELPTDVDEQKEYIRQLVTPNQFDAIYEVYEGQDVLQLMRDDLFDFSRIKGLGETTYKNIKNKLLGNEGLQELLAWLGKFGVRYNTVAKIVDSFDSPQIAKQMIEENPYLLAKHVNGIGFIKADEIAIKMGIERDSPRRIKACITHAIKEENGNGNAYILEKELLERCGAYLELSHDKISEQLHGEFREVKIIEDKITLKQIYEAEQFIAQRLVELNEFRYDLDIHVEEDGEVEIKEKEPFDVKGFLERYCKANEVVLTEEQESFFYKFMEHNVLFLVANAGSGKSFLQKILVAMLREMGLTFGLYAPTGK